MAAMRGRIRLLRLSLGYERLLLAFFLIGVVCGTAAANFVYQTWAADQKGDLAGLLDRGLRLSAVERRELFFWVLRQRLFETLAAWAAGLTVFSIPCFYVLAVGCGAASGLALSVITIQKGLLGLPWYLGTLFPHYFFYIPVWCVLARWAGRRNGRLRLVPLAALLAMSAAGAATETWINPVFLKMTFF